MLTPEEKMQTASNLIKAYRAAIDGKEMTPPELLDLVATLAIAVVLEASHFMKNNEAELVDSRLDDIFAAGIELICNKLKSIELEDIKGMTH